MRRSKRTFSFLNRQNAQLLPDREAMSLLSTDYDSLLAGYGGSGIEDATSPTASTDGVSATATDTAQDAYEIAQVDASGSEAASITDQDRSETFHQTDSAVAES